jgi:hypothetical protein
VLPTEITLKIKYRWFHVKTNGMAILERGLPICGSRPNLDLTFSTPYIGHSKLGLLCTRLIISPMLNLLKRTMPYPGSLDHHTVPLHHLGRHGSHISHISEMTKFRKSFLNFVSVWICMKIASECLTPCSLMLRAKKSLFYFYEKPSIFLIGLKMRI